MVNNPINIFNSYSNSYDYIIYRTLLKHTVNFIQYAYRFVTFCIAVGILTVFFVDSCDCHYWYSSQSLHFQWGNREILSTTMKQSWGIRVKLNLIGPQHNKAQIICIHRIHMMTSSNGNLFRVTGLLCGKCTGHRWIPRTKTIDAELWCFLWSVSEPTFEQTVKTPVIWDPSHQLWRHCNDMTECERKIQYHLTTRAIQKRQRKSWLRDFGSKIPFDIYLEMTYNKAMLRLMTDGDGFLGWTFTITKLPGGWVDLSSTRHWISIDIRVPSQYKDRLIYIWWFPC